MEIFQNIFCFPFSFSFFAFPFFFWCSWWKYSEKQFFFRSRSIPRFISHEEYFNNDTTKADTLENSENTVNTRADHIQFRITEVAPKTPKTPKETSTTERDLFEKETVDDIQLVAEEPLVSPQIFCQVFPFHLMFNRQMKIVQAGKSVSRVIPKVGEENCNLLDVLDPIRPHIQLSFQTILAHISTIYVLKTKAGMMLEANTFMRLKVCMIWQELMFAAN